MFGKLFNRADCDVVVLGSGAAGLTAAILAHDHGARVRVIEKTASVGGTSAVSGAGMWIPNNHLMSEVGGEDSREDALAYCKALAMGRTDDSLLEAFVDTAPRMLRYLEANTGLRFSAMSAPDYHPEAPGGRLCGRSVEPRLFDAGLLGPWRDKLRPPSMMTFSMTLEEIYHVYQAFYRPWAVPQDLLAERMKQGLVSLGQALAGGLLHAVLQRGIPIVLQTRAIRLLGSGGSIEGVAVRGPDGAETEVRARKAVILATAGFEWSPELQARFLPGRITHPNSPPANEGDGLRLAMAVGADLANMSEAWNYPSIAVPGETYEGRPLARGIKAERSGPHIIWVNAEGRRFVNESANYNSVGKAFYELETNGPRYRNMPAWAILDQQFRRKYIVGTATPDDPDPDWLARADTLEELARKIGIDPSGLQATVARWNECVAQGSDPDFHRGESAFDRYQGDHTAPHPNLGTIEQGPYYALPVHPGALGTKGGVRTDAHARVLDTAGQPIGRLYAAGNVAASITGPSYFGVGATLGPAMTWGYIAGRHAAGAA